MSVANIDFICGDALECLEWRAGELPLKESFLDFFHRMPNDPQVVSHISHGHVSGEFQDVTLERSGVSLARICERDPCLPSLSTTQAKESLNETLDQGEPQTHWECLPDAADLALFLHRSTPTMGTRKRRGVLIGSERGTALLKSRMHAMDSPSRSPETVIEYTRGHDFLAFSDFPQTKECRKSSPPFVYNAGTHLREEPGFLPFPEGDNNT